MPTDDAKLDVKRIWDRAPHNAFTDLVRFRDRWYCAFREGQAHVSDDGRLCVLSSDDGDSWDEVQTVSWRGGDVRDAKLSITPSGQLMLNGAIRFINPVSGHVHQSVTWLSDDGKTFGDAWACPTGLGTWRWSVTWHAGLGYSFGRGDKDPRGALYRTADGKMWHELKRDPYPPGYCNESSIVFDPDDVAWCLLRRDKHSSLPGVKAFLGRAEPPYTDWQWSELDRKIGGPKMIRLDDGRFIAIVRLYEDGAHTMMCEVDPKENVLHELLRLPSGGDTSYAGMVVHEGNLWVSYYSTHEEKTAIYLARLEVP